MGRAAGLTLKDVQGMVYNPIKNTWALAPDDTDVNYIMHLVREKKKGP